MAYSYLNFCTKCNFFKLVLICFVINVVQTNEASDKKELEWWQKTVFYQVYPRSFRDSDGDGIGDLKGIEEKAEYFKDIGVGAIWLSPIFKSPMADFGYDISNYTDIYEKFGTLDDLKNLKKKLESLGIKLVLDFVPNHTSDESEWFIKSVKRIDPYTDFYVWKNPKGYDKKGNPIPPNNWISIFNYVPAWTFNKERKQFYLHQFLNKQPDLNYRSTKLQEAMKDVIKFWLDAGIDGFRIDAVPYLIEDERFLDEPYVNPNDNHYMYSNLVHKYTMDQPKTFDIIRSWREVFDQYSNGGKNDSRVMLTEAYTDLTTTMKYYGTEDKPISHMPFNFQLITQLSAQSNSKDFEKSIKAWLNKMPKGKWPNWVIGNHDQNRVSARYGTDLVDALNMLVSLLPGTAVTYYGEELGMENTFVRWDQTVDPQGVAAGKDGYIFVTRDLCRSPMQWDDSLDSGFSKAEKTWLPVNPNFWRLNVKNENSDGNSHLNTYKKLVEARKTPTIQFGDLNTFTPDNWTLVFTRSLVNETTYIVVINLGSEEKSPDLSKVGLPDNVYVYATSANSFQKIGDKLATKNLTLTLRPKAAVVLTSAPSSSTAIAGSIFIILLIMFLREMF